MNSFLKISFIFTFSKNLMCFKKIFCKTCKLNAPRHLMRYNALEVS